MFLEIKYTSSPSGNQTAQVPLLLIFMVPHCNPKTTYCLSHVLKYSRHPIYTSHNHIYSIGIRTIQFKNTRNKRNKGLPFQISAAITVENAMRINVPWIRFSKDSHTWKPPGLQFSKAPLGVERLTLL